MQAGLRTGSAPTSSYRPALRLIPNSELDARAQQERQQAQPQIIGLEAYLKKLWSSAETAKQEIQQQILADYRRRNGEYSESKLAEIKKFGGSAIYMLLVNEMCRSVEAYCKEVMLPGDDKPWSMEPTPQADLPMSIQQEVVQRVWQEAVMLFEAEGVQVSQEAMLMRAAELNEQAKERLQHEAEERATKMERTIEDQLAEGGWDQAFNEFLYDFSTTKAAILKGPIVRKRKTLEWAQSPEGKYVPQVRNTYKLEWERRSPLDIYPSADATSIQDGYLFDRHQLSLTSLNSMRGLKGVDETVLNSIIEDYGRSGYKTLESGDFQRGIIEQRRYAYWAGHSSTIEAKEFWGPVPGYLLQEWGMQVEDKYDVYHINAWIIADRVVKATINEDLLGRRPYSKCSFEKLPGGFWGRGPSELLDDVDQMCNAIARAIVNNCGMASGPQTAINDSTRLPPDENVNEMWPWKVWVFGPDKLATSHRPPIEFFQPDLHAEQLMRVYEFFAQKATGIIGMPSYPMDDLKGAAKSTASGMSMALGQASKGAKSMFRNLDLDILETAITRMFDFNMLYNPDESIKGDIKCKPKASTAMLVKEHQQLRRQEFLASTNNPADLQIIGLEGRANLLREAAKSLDMPVDKIIPKDEPALRAMMEGAQPGQAPGKPQQVDAAGHPVAGQDTAIFQQ